MGLVYGALNLAPGQEILSSTHDHYSTEMPHVRLYTPMSPAPSAGIICFDVSGYTAEEVIAHLSEQRIIAAASPYRNSYPRLAPGVINTAEEVQRSIAAIREFG